MSSEKIDPPTNNGSLKAAAIQMVSGTDYRANLTKAEVLIQRAAEGGAQLVVLPEYFSIMGQRDRDKLAYQVTAIHHEFLDWLSAQARTHRLWIVGGSHPAQANENQAYGRCYVANAEGEIIGHYDKIHLFDVEVGDNVGNYYESKYTRAGSDPFCFDSPWGRIGVAICYDLRFPELFRALQAAGAQLLVLPAAFTRKTGEAHWATLIRARAIENLSAFIASAQGGCHENGRTTWGHSQIVDCWGRLLSEIETGEGIAMATIDLNAQREQRRKFPALAHRKL